MYVFGVCVVCVRFVYPLRMCVYFVCIVVCICCAHFVYGVCAVCVSDVYCVFLQIDVMLLCVLYVCYVSMFVHMFAVDLCI